MNRKTVLGIYLGNLLENFDSSLYAFLSPLFATLFFPEQDYLTALIVTYSFIPIAKLAKPIGALYFGHLGDSAGRSKALCYSLCGMALSTFLIGTLPTYSSIGMFAPFLLLLARSFQSFCSAGETMGGAIYWLENTAEEKKDFASGIFSTSTIAGILLSSTSVTLLYQFGMISSVWRLLYFFGASTALIAFYLRKNEIKKIDSDAISFQTRVLNLWEMRSKIGVIMLASGFSHATYMMIFVLLIGFVPMISDLSKADMMKSNSWLLLFDFLLLPLFGYLGGRLSRENLMIGSSLCLGIIALPLFSILGAETVDWIRMVFVVLGVCFSATFHSWSQNLVPKFHRYSLVSFSYALGSQMIGGTSAALSLAIYKLTNIPSSICWYWLFLAFATSYVLLSTKKNEVANMSNELQLSH
ncbi:MAG: MFS transporter [Waddliaceae bacterium]